MKRLALLFLSMLIAALAEQYEPITGRSSRWDKMMLEHKTQHKRQANSEWQMRDECTRTPQDVIQFDALGRRNRDILATPTDQRSCGSCWAFASTHAVADSLNLQADRRLDLLSTQDTTRCATKSNNYGYGCCGDTPVNGFKYLLSNGAVTDTCLPYNYLSSKPPSKYKKNEAYKSNNQKMCFAACADGSAFDRIAIEGSYSALPTNAYNDNTIINALTNNQVVLARIWVNNDFVNYGCGVLTTALPTDADKKRGHSVVIVDYGTTTDTNTNVPFWVIKNSWGTDYGENGYIRVRRRQGELGIGMRPIVLLQLSSDTALPPSDTDAEDQETCVPEDVAEPRNDNTTMSAVEFALEGLANQGRVECPNGQAATGLTLISFDDADVQIVAGSIVDLVVETNLEGCETAVTKTLSLTVFIDLDGMFTLTNFSVGNMATILAGSMLLLFTTVITSFVLGN